MTIPTELIFITFFLIGFFSLIVFFVMRHTNINTLTPVEFDMGIDITPNHSHHFIIIHNHTNCDIDCANL
jgi:hypothetical protein